LSESTLTAPAHSTTRVSSLFKSASLSRKQNIGAASALMALGVVFGDIGTSPLYAMNQLLYHSSVNASRPNVMGATSLLLWILTIVVCFKYITIVLRADNAGEGGVFALLALVRKHKGRFILLLSSVLVFAAGMLLGDGTITPAISVLSAVEGLKVATPDFARFAVPLTLVILLMLFSFQSRGTAKVGRLFGPVMLVWFSFLFITGLRSLIADPAILRAVNPWWAIKFLGAVDISQTTLVLGSVILVVTGGEALFADLGHFGKRPVRTAWVAVVFPALVVNYLGQGAFALGQHTILSDNLFFSMVPRSLLYPGVVLATMATVIASQALISGAFSLVSQGIALGFVPIMRIIHTHDKHEGQTYLPAVNWLLFGGSALLVIGFRTSGHLAAAYGLAVASDMLTTTLALSVLSRKAWRWSLLSVAAIFIPIGLIDASLFAGNLVKIPSGGYVPLTVGAFLGGLMMTWKWGRNKVRTAFANQSSLSMEQVVELKNSCGTCLPKPMIFLAPNVPNVPQDKAPPLLELFMQRFGCLPRNVIVLRIAQDKEPYVPAQIRYEVQEFENDSADDRSLLAITAWFGFREQPDVQEVIEHICSNQELSMREQPHDWLITAGKERLLASRDQDWWEHVRFSAFKTISRVAEPPYSYFGLHVDARLAVEFVPVVL
jgi:KUP system potassium uptake protein